MKKSISELRKIYFPHDDVKLAVTTFFKHSQKGNYDPLRIALTLMKSDTEVCAQVQYLWPDKADTKEEIKLNSNQLCAALMSYCFELKIPLPKTSIKKLSLDKDTLVLELLINSPPLPN